MHGNTIILSTMVLLCSYYSSMSMNYVNVPARCERIAREASPKVERVFVEQWDSTTFVNVSLKEGTSDNDRVNTYVTIADRISYIMPLGNSIVLTVYINNSFSLGY